jgi:hypothetical protein
MPIQGFTRLRKHQFGRQSLFGDAESATRAYPFQGTPDVNLNWTDPEGDFGSLYPIAAPYRAAPEIGASLTAPIVNYNDLPLYLAGFFGGGVTPTTVASTGKTWAWTPGWDTADAFDYFTYEFGDDVTTDWFQLRDGILTNVQFTGPETMGPISSSMTWKFGAAFSSGSTDFPDVPTVPTAGLSVDSAGIPVYLKDMKIYIDSTAGTLGNTQILDALHSFQLTLNQEVDEKRYANGTQTFDLNGYGRGAITAELQCTFAKTADTVGIGSEADAWMSDTAVDRFVRLSFTSTALVGGTTPYSWVINLPMRYYTRAEGEINGNTTVVLTGHAFVEAATLDYAIDTTVVNTLTDPNFESGS